MTKVEIMGEQADALTKTYTIPQKKKGKMTLNGLPASEPPPELVDLFDKAKSGQIDRAEFSRELELHGITGFRKMLYIGRAFGLTLNQVKEMHIKEQYGSHENWLEEIGLTDRETLEEIGKSDYSNSE